MPRWVIDTNILVSRLLLPGSIPARAVAKAMAEGELLMSVDTFRELSETLSRSKFDKYLDAEDRREFLELLAVITVQVGVIRMVRASRDTKDDIFLSLALAAGADAIITGDKDLLVLDPFRGIPIMTPSAFLQWHGK